MTASPTCVLDASALLAVLNNEPGGPNVLDVLGGALLSAVNWSEIVQKSLESGIAASPSRLRRDVEGLGVTIVPFGAEDAELAAQLRSSTQILGLSLADRACLALAARTDLPALTADRAWAGLDVGIRVRLFR